MPSILPELLVEATPAEKRRLLQLQARRDTLKQARVAREDVSAGAMARRLDPLTVQTPALRRIDAELVDIRDAIAVMLRRREVFAQAMKEVDQSLPEAEKMAAEEAAAEEAELRVPAAGNTRLVVSMPPQEGKTERIGRRGLIWLLRQFPGLRVGVVSYDGGNAERISYAARMDIETFSGEAGAADLGLRLAKNQRAISRWRLAAPHGGDVYAIGIGGGITGRPLDFLLIDDPVKDMQAADSLLRSSQAWDWWETVARPRLAPWAPCIIVATRWHEADLIGRVLSKQGEDQAAGLENYERWRALNISAEAEHRPERGETDELGREPGEFMLSARGRSRAQWETVKAGVSRRHWSALYQGRPTPEEGDIWLRGWWQRYDEPLVSQHPDGSFRLPAAFTVIQSWDMAFKDKKTSDFVAGGVWAKKGADTFLIYQRWARLSFPDTLDAVRDVTRLFPQARRKLVEEKANGTAVIESLKHEIPGITPCEPEGSKTARADAVSPFIRAGNVHVPSDRLARLHPAIAWDVGAFLLEATSFPNAKNDDQVDQASQALAELYLGSGGVSRLHVPKGETPRRVARSGTRVGVQLSPLQRALTGRQIK
jgi:predicted phage terminase large subunit-like protein